MAPVDKTADASSNADRRRQLRGAAGATRPADGPGRSARSHPQLPQGRPSKSTRAAQTQQSTELRGAKSAGPAAGQADPPGAAGPPPSPAGAALPSRGAAVGGPASTLLDPTPPASRCLPHMEQQSAIRPEEPSAPAETGHLGPEAALKERLETQGAPSGQKGAAVEPAAGRQLEDSRIFGS